MQNQSIVMSSFIVAVEKLKKARPALFTGDVKLTNAESIGDIVEIRYPRTMDVVYAEAQVRAVLAERGFFTGNPLIGDEPEDPCFVSYEFSSIRGTRVVLTRSTEDDPEHILFTILPPESL